VLSLGWCARRRSEEQGGKGQMDGVHRRRWLCGLTLAFSCGARSASKLKERSYLRNVLSRRQLQGFVGRRFSIRHFY